MTFKKMLEKQILTLILKELFSKEKTTKSWDFIATFTFFFFYFSILCLSLNSICKYVRIMIVYFNRGSM